MCKLFKQKKTNGKSHQEPHNLSNPQCIYFHHRLSTLNNSYILMSQEHSIHPSHWLLEADDSRMSTGSMSTFFLFFFQKEKGTKTLRDGAKYPLMSFVWHTFRSVFFLVFGNLLGFTLNCVVRFLMFFMFCKITSSFFNHNSILFYFFACFVVQGWIQTQLLYLERISINWQHRF